MTLLSVVIPAYNEEKTILRVLNKVKSLDLKSVKKEIIVVSDGSKDNTLKIAKSVKGIKVISLPFNQGKGAAVRAGIANSTGGIIIIQDADFEYNPEEYPSIIEPILSGKAQVVYGSRFLSLLNKERAGIVRKHEGAYTFHSLGSRIVTFTTNLLFNTKITDEATCYKCFKSEVIKAIKIENNGFAWEPEVTAKIARRGIKIYEVPISYKPRTFEEGKKINWKDGLEALWTLLKYRIVK